LLEIDALSGLALSIAAAVKTLAATARSTAENANHSDTGLRKVTRKIAESATTSTQIAVKNGVPIAEWSDG